MVSGFAFTPRRAVGACTQKRGWHVRCVAVVTLREDRYERSTSTIGAVLLAAGLCSCQNGPTNQEYDEVAAGLGTLIADGDDGGDVGAMAEAVLLARGEVPAGLSRTATGSYEGEHGGLRYEYMLTCVDASGVELTACGPQTDGGRLVLAWDGNLDTPRFTGVVQRTGDWTLTGLSGETAEFNGQGTFDVDAEWLFLGAMHSYRFQYDAQYTGVTWRMADGVPVAGTARWDVQAEKTRTRGARTAERSWQIEAIVTFDNGTATLMLDGSREYRGRPVDGGDDPHVDKEARRPAGESLARRRAVGNPAARRAFSVGGVESGLRSRTVTTIRTACSLLLLTLLACAPGVGLSPAGSRVAHVERQDLPYGCRVVADVPVGVAPDASRAGDEEQFVLLLRNKSGHLGATHVVTDHSERRGTGSQTRWVGRGRAYRCGEAAPPGESGSGSSGGEEVGPVEEAGPAGEEDPTEALFEGDL